MEDLNEPEEFMSNEKNNTDPVRALAELVGAAGLMLSEIDTCGHPVDPAYRATLHDAWTNGQAALAAQPSPGGQRDALPPLPAEVDSVVCMIRGEKDIAEPLDYYYTADQMRAYAQAALAARQPVGEPVEHACSNCDRKHAEVICPTCAGIAWDNGRLHEFYEVRELSTSLGEGVLDHLLPDEWHEKPLLRFQGAYDEGDHSVGIGGRSGNVLAADQSGTVLGDYLAARAAKEGGQ